MQHLRDPDRQELKDAADVYAGKKIAARPERWAARA
jgi:hypothetical protein